MDQLNINLADLKDQLLKMKNTITQAEESRSNSAEDSKKSQEYWKDAPGDAYRLFLEEDQAQERQRLEELERVYQALQKAQAVFAAECERLKAGVSVLNGLKHAVPEPVAVFSVDHADMKVNYPEMEGLITELASLLDNGLDMDGTEGQYGAWKNCVRHARSLNYSSVSPSDYNSRISTEMEETESRFRVFKGLLEKSLSSLRAGEKELEQAVSV